MKNADLEVQEILARWFANSVNLKFRDSKGNLIALGRGERTNLGLPFKVTMLRFCRDRSIFQKIKDFFNKPTQQELIVELQTSEVYAFHRQHDVPMLKMKGSDLIWMNVYEN